ncbi:hypothetical protein POSPLADRAFT_1076338 [Postia placenta MAD-698-R-SB12]|uniref:Peptidase A1 domain-containing protein n=1 Tax=Postia placenta MAD-698-R-SB12 TaxID=670580 RepID=A0A1X6MLK7_9APHY|nr:hypothetical protein POSPLADRAFT_1076338 [Postia placenta MAD-698-R-SB12]OSX57062.1 hypothetical protein POSPLADRAFT_1076338 [Postia placenta MAD-698-R-SB12]
MHADAASTSRVWKGKARQQPVRREGPGGNGGVVLPLQLLSGSPYESVYTLSVLVGPSRQNLSLQVDTGSADLWIASKSCSSSSCSQTGGHLYDPSSSTSTGQTFDMTYAEGQVIGPIVWDTVDVGGYTITNQALAAASTVNEEPLESEFTGILGLALPLDSEIAQQVPQEFTNNADGAAFASNLFSMTPNDTAPAEPFISLALERPGSSAVPSVLGIGRHPDAVVSDPSTIHYASLVTERVGALYWEASVRGITVWVNGEPKEVTLGESVSGLAYPSAVLDSGTPVILASPSIANGIYGALGISPTSDGTYYVPCTMPINMTITLDDRPPIALHPLDLSYPPDSGATVCTGMIQNAALIGASISLPDLVLGVPFLRSTYTVMAYEPPDSAGAFLPNDTVQAAGYMTNPRLGLLGLTNATTALQEFTTVRVNNQPLDPTAQGSTPALPTHHKLSVGVDVVLGCVGFFVLCGLIFGARWMYMRRRPRLRSLEALRDSGSKGDLADVAYILARRGSMTDRYSTSDDTARASRYSQWSHRADVSSQYTTDTHRMSHFSDYGAAAVLPTHAEQDAALRYTDTTLVADPDAADEFGRAAGKLSPPPGSGSPGFPTGAGTGSIFARQQDQRYSLTLPGSPPNSPPYMHRFLPGRPGPCAAPPHRRTASDDSAVAVPLLERARSEDVTEGAWADVRASIGSSAGAGSPRGTLASLPVVEGQPRVFAALSADPGARPSSARSDGPGS